MSLAARLRARIEEEGPLTFAAFMEAALYDEQDGFYARGPALGLGGAFSTAPTRHPKFAEAVAAELRDLGPPTPGAAYVEVGPGDGTLAAAMPRGTPIVLVERADGMRRRQLARVPEAQHRSRLEDVHVPCGLVVANELFDALPVHLHDAGGELRVGADLRWERPPRGEVVATCPGAAPMLEALASSITQGRLLIVDYGDDRPAAAPMPVRTYVGGRAGGDVLQAPGSQDLTADVDFGVLRRKASEIGLRELVYESQDAWLRRRTLRPLAGTEAWYVEQTLAELPFRVLLLEKG